MAYELLLQPGNESPGYYVLTADASTQTTEDNFFFLEHTRDARTQTTEEDFDFPSQFQLTRNVSITNLESTVDASEAAQFGNAIEIESVNVNDEKKFVCKVCEKDIVGHSEKPGRCKWYLCCVCTYMSNRRAYLQRHINIHHAQNICDICTREYTEGEPHLNEKICNVCKEEFDCKTFLDLHCVIDHEEYFLTHCLVCDMHLEKHSNKCDGGIIFACCACGYSNYESTSLVHNNTHRPQLFCIICRQEYPANETDRHGKEFKCFVCKETFQCLTFIDEHFEVHRKILSSKCVVCLEQLNSHAKYSLFQCCVCSRNFQIKYSFQKHLLTHSRLKLFKCAACGERFSSHSSRTYHLKSCTPSLFKCEICRARFPCSISLKEHCSKKHPDLQ